MSARQLPPNSGLATLGLSGGEWLDAVASALDTKCAILCPNGRSANVFNPKTTLNCANRRVVLAVAEGFEPSDGGYPSHAFEACSLGRSDTPPCGSYRPCAASPNRTEPP